MSDNYQEWTPCQWSGHHFEDERCRDCGEPVLDCGSCGADLGPSDYPWHYPDQDCRAVRTPQTT